MIDLQSKSYVIEQVTSTVDGLCKKQKTLEYLRVRNMIKHIDSSTWIYSPSTQRKIVSKIFYIVISCIVLQGFIFHLYHSIDYLSYEITIMRNGDNSSLVLRYSLLFQTQNNNKSVNQIIYNI